MLALSWLTGKQSLSPKELLFIDLFEECSLQNLRPTLTQILMAGCSLDPPPLWNSADHNKQWQSSWHDLSPSVKTRLEKCSKEEPENNIVNRTKDGCSPFFVACKLGHYHIVKYLLEVCQVDIEKRGNYESIEDNHSVSPIWAAAVSGHVRVVELLIKHKANINSRSDTGSTPLRSVCFQCKYDDGDHENGYNLNNVTTNETVDIAQIDGQLDDNSKNYEENYMQIVRLLVANGADISIANYNGGTCLINSIHSYKLTQFLIDNGAQIDASDHEGKTALHYAIAKGRSEVTKLLLSRGANPMLKANSQDDALKLSCIGGHVSIFDHLIRTFRYPKSKLIEAHKLLGSSILELHYDLTKVRELWSKALELRQELIEEQVDRIKNATFVKSVLDQIDELAEEEPHRSPNSSSISCDIRRALAFGDSREITTQSELLSLSADEFRIQSLIISERLLGPGNRETVQRLLSRGTNYIKSLRPDRCIDLWIYALQLKLKYESIFNSESILAVQTITNLFLDLLSQRIEVKFQDIYDVLSLLINQLDDCQRHLSQRPVSYLHNYIFDRLLEIIKNLLLVLDCTTEEFNYEEEEEEETSLLKELKHKQHSGKVEMINKLVKIDPRTSNGSSLLHLCIVPDKHDVQRLVACFAKKDAISHIIKLIDMFIESGMKIDVPNYNGLSPLQVLCSTNVSGIMDKKLIIRRLAELGAHLDRRPSSPEQGKIIRHGLRDAGIDPMSHLRLSCLAARQLAAAGVTYDVNLLTRHLRDLIAIH